MRSADQIHFVIFQKVFHHISAEDVAHSPLAFVPAETLLVWVAPEQVAEHPLVGHFHRPGKLVYLIWVFQVRRKPSVHAEYFIVYYSCHGQAVEALGEGLPQLDRVPPLALIVEPVYSVDSLTLVISS